MVSWKAPTAENGRPFGSYRVKVKQKNVKKAIIVNNLPSTATSYTLKRSKLLKHTKMFRGDMVGQTYRYQVRVQAINDSGASAPTAEWIVLTTT